MMSGDTYRAIGFVAFLPLVSLSFAVAMSILQVNTN
jgi:hypothetical protein